MSISKRGTEYLQIGGDHGELDVWDPVNNPNAMLKFSYSENRLMHKQLSEFINRNNTFDVQCCSYGEGYTGSHRLRKAMANHINEYFHPQQPLDAENITFAAGVTALNEACTLGLCDDGDAIMLGDINYGAFPTDLVARTGVSLVYAHFDESDQFSESCVQYFEAAYDRAKQSGMNVRGLLLCNPHNPLGRCYTPTALKGLLQFCQHKEIHLISDEIYALSVYHRPNRENESFTSVLSFGQDVISPDRVHVLYGFSKDYGAGGLRLGCLVSRNETFTQAVRYGVCRFSSPSIFSMDVATKMLEDRPFITKYLRDSVDALSKQRVMIESLLNDAGLAHSKEGNAGLFIWLDLSAYLDHQPEDDIDPWAAEARFTKRLADGGVSMSTGKRYQSTKPGNYRMIFSYDGAMLREGVKRIQKVCQGVLP